MVAWWKINGKLKITLLENSLDQWSCILKCIHIADLSTIKLEILLKYKINWCQRYYWYANGIKHLEETLKQLTLQKKVWNVESENYNFGKMQMKTQLLVKHWNISDDENIIKMPTHGNTESLWNAFSLCQNQNSIYE